MNEERTSKRLSIRHIRAFVAVAKHRSLTRAAESLFVTQSALSLTIQHLEDDLGVSLFDRSTRRLDLTQAGEEFLPSAERLLQDFDSSIREMRAPEQQRLIALLAALSHDTSFSVGCYCEDESRCHRSILRRELLRRGAAIR